MEGVRALLLAVVFVVADLPWVLGFPLTAPAFLWSPQPYRSPHYNNKEFVDYRTISSKDLTKLVLSEGGWSNILCSKESLNENMDVAVVFVGRKLHSSDISSPKQSDASLIDILKLSFTTSNFSMAFPYVAIDEQETLENSLIEGLSGLTDKWEDGFSCSSRTSGKTDLVVLCSGRSEESGHTQSEGMGGFSDIVDLLKQSGAKYTVLYTSRPYKTLQYPAHLALRFLADGTQSNASNSSTCDGVCQIKSSLLEGIFVAIVLLIILISGLCCMIGIDTPTRFETSQES
ncbi:hypothetical protein C4D60_Mb06t00810 [Musa balbisiana]|uniref:V-type proton ATPase subunit S1/VOA1 transmembrane domain-containing protein n=1 Tax=Musa balbisiana TaxID=52838 RepID=A0A4S8IJQ6_MUSBA|nr:hypothetical protein C4D60_Mb06t00810 [Musa balbisiana]